MLVCQYRNPEQAGDYNLNSTGDEVVRRAFHADGEAMRLRLAMLEDLDKLKAYRLYHHRDVDILPTQISAFQASKDWVKQQLASTNDLEELQTAWRVGCSKQLALIDADLDCLSKAADLVKYHKSESSKLSTDHSFLPTSHCTSIQEVLCQNINKTIAEITKDLREQPYSRILIKLHEIIKEARHLQQHFTANSIIEAGRLCLQDIEPELFQGVNGLGLYEKVIKVCPPNENIVWAELDLSSSYNIPSFTDRTMSIRAEAALEEGLYDDLE